MGHRKSKGWYAWHKKPRRTEKPVRPSRPDVTIAEVRRMSTRLGIVVNAPPSMIVFSWRDAILCKWKPDSLLASVDRGGFGIACNSILEAFGHAVRQLAVLEVAAGESEEDEEAGLPTPDEPTLETASGSKPCEDSTLKAPWEE